MVRIVHVISALSTGGAEMMLAKLVGGMDRERFSNTVISLIDEGPLKEQIERLGIAVYTLGMKRRRPNIFALPRLIRLLIQIRPTIVQSWLYHADVLSTIAVKLSGLPILIWNVRCSDMDLTKYRPLTRWARRLLACWSGIPNVVIVNSEVGKKLHEQLGYRPKRWEIMPNGFDVDRFRPDDAIRMDRRKEWGLSDDAVVVALIARVDPMKDHDTFLEAAQRTARARQNVHFILIGQGTEKLTEAVACKGLGDLVHLLGYRSDVERILPGVDVLCLSSAFGEGFPNVIGEAMACGVPCVATDVGDARSIIDKTGLVVSSRDPSALAKALINLIDRGHDGRENLGRAARERIEKAYSLPRIIDRYMALYLELGGKPEFL